MLTVRYLGAGLLAAACTCASAHEPATAPAPLGDDRLLTIDITPLAATADDMVQPADTLSGDELLRHSAGTLGETLGNQLGVSNASFGPGAGRSSIRGQAGPRVSVLQNGVSGMDVSSLSQDHAVSLDPGIARQIEIIKGPATLLYGSGAIGGVINVVDDRLPGTYTPGLQGDLSYAYGSNADQQQTRAHVDYGIGGFMLHADGGLLRSGDLDIPGFSGKDGTGSARTLPNSAVDTQSGALSASHVSDNGSIGLAYSRYASTYGLPQESTAFIDLNQSRTDFKGVLRNPATGLESLTLKAGYTDYSHTEYEDPVTPGTVFLNRQGEVRTEAVHAPLAGFRGVMGVQLGQRDFSAVGAEALLQPVSSRDAGVFVVEQKTLGPVQAEAGLRVETVQHRPAAVRPSDGQPNADPRNGQVYRNRSFLPVSLSLGGLMEFGPRHHLRLNAARSQRAPSPEELYAFGPHIATSNFERGLERARKETYHSVELGLDRHDADWTWTTNLYYTDARDYLFLREIDAGLDADGTASSPLATGSADGAADRVNEDGEFDPSGELLLVDYQQARARFHGFEAETAYRWVIQGLSLQPRLFADLVRGRLADGGNLPRISPARVGIGLLAASGDLTIDVSLTHALKQDRIQSLETATDSYDLLNARIGYDLPTRKGRISLFLRGQNLLDEDIRQHASFIKDRVPQPGRSLISGVRFEL